MQKSSFKFQFSNNGLKDYLDNHKKAERGEQVYLSDGFTARVAPYHPPGNCQTPHFQGDDLAKRYIGIAAAGGNGIRNSNIAKFPRRVLKAKTLTRFLQSRSSSENNHYPYSLWFRHWDILRRICDTLKTIRVRFVPQLIRIEL